MKSAIVGLGVIGRVHADILEKEHEKAVAVCDLDLEKCNHYVYAKQYSDYIKMLNEVCPDVVHICTPHYLHADMICEALKRNINVLCEKPLCIKEEDIPRILEEEKNSKAQLGVCLQNRYNPSVLFVKEYLTDKKIESAYATVVWSRDATYYRSGEWRGKWQTEGGGVLINQALHTLDLVEWLTDKPQFVTANISNLTLKNIIEVEDTASAIFSGNSEISFFATVGSKNNFSVEITIRTKNETIRILPDCVYINEEKKSFKSENKFYGKCCYGIGHEKLIADFYNCIQTGKKFAIDGKEGAEVVKLILACYRSHGEKVRI